MFVTSESTVGRLIYATVTSVIRHGPSLLLPAELVICEFTMFVLGSRVQGAILGEVVLGLASDRGGGEAGDSD